MGEGQWIDAAELAIRRVLDERFDGADRVSLAGLAENVKRTFAFSRKFHNVRPIN